MREGTLVRWTTITLSAIGLTVGVAAVLGGRQEPPEPPLARRASINPYLRGVAALGILEAQGRNIAASAPEPGLVTDVFVDVGDTLAADAPLFKLDSRTLESELIRARAAVDVARAELQRAKDLPRPEDIPPLEASVAVAEAVLADREEQLALNEDALRRGGATSREVSLSRYNRDAAAAELARARAELAKAKAGAWAPDLAIRQAELDRTQAEVSALEARIARLTVRAPKAVTVLSRDIEPGEYAVADPNRPAMIIGDLSTLHVRAQVDEEDIALVREGAQAMARTRGAIVQDIGLEIIRIEPFARRKVDITGANAERVDTRVIDVVFRVVDKPSTPLFPGQAVDVFINAEDVEPTPVSGS